MRSVLTVVSALLCLAVFAMLSGRHAAPADSNAVIVLTVDCSRTLGTIDPNIYGLAQPTQEHFAQLRPTLVRWGGNPATRYNWERGNCWNSARDWRFQNGNYNSTAPRYRQPSGAADIAIAGNTKQNARTLLTVPTMGWVAANDDPECRSLNVPSQSGAPDPVGSERIAGYDPAANRRRVSVRSLPRKGSRFSETPDRMDGTVYQDEWVAHLVAKFGSANAGGVRWYAMDNEPDLWDSTHTDMHPVRADYQEVLDRFLAYADAVKDVDPTAQVTGPVSWGWSGYFFSARDKGADNFRTHADRQAHGGTAFLPWFLREVARHDRRTGRRTLDMLDVHYYPQGDGIYAGRTDARTNAKRLRSTRALWDADYIDESWVDAPVQLLPRLRSWVDRYYPGTKIGLTEWSWGADQTLNGGLTIAEVLGILGREGVDAAAYWGGPSAGKPGFFAYKMYRNADGKQHGFGDRTLAVHSNDADRVSCFAALDSRDGTITIIALNKSDRAANARLILSGGRQIRTAAGYRYDGHDLEAIAVLPDTELRDGACSLNLPGSSLTLLRCR